LTTVGVHQPNYLPWLGYFRKIAMSDVFVFFDNVQMPGGKSFVSRNAIKTAQGRHWLTVPIADKSSQHPINKTRVAGDAWVRKHLRTLELSYSHSPWHHLIEAELAPVLQAGHETIADLNVALITRLTGLLGLADVVLTRATSLSLAASGAASIPEILERVGARVYLTGSGGGSTRHLDVEDLAARGVKTRVVSTYYPTYPQDYGAFEPNLSIVDALLNVGPEETKRMLETVAPETPA